MSGNEQLILGLSNLGTEIQSTFETFVAESARLSNTIKENTQRLKDLNSVAASLPKEVAIAKMLELTADEDNKTKPIFANLNQCLDTYESLGEKWAVKYQDLVKVDLLDKEDLEKTEGKVDLLDKEDLEKTEGLVAFIQLCSTIFSLAIAALEVFTNQIANGTQTPTITNVVTLNRRFIKIGTCIITSFNDTAKELQRLLSAQVSNEIN